VYIDSNDAELTNHIEQQWNCGSRGGYRLFHPELACQQMRKHLSGGYPESPATMWVVFPPESEQIKPVLDAIPGYLGRWSCTHRWALEKHFAGTPTHFVGYLTGKLLLLPQLMRLSPSRTETLGLVLLGNGSWMSGCGSSCGIPDIVADGNVYLTQKKRFWCDRHSTPLKQQQNGKLYAKCP